MNNGMCHKLNLTLKFPPLTITGAPHLFTSPKVYKFMFSLISFLTLLLLNWISSSKSAKISQLRIVTVAI